MPSPKVVASCVIMVRIGTRPIENDPSMIIPQESILADSQGSYVYTVDEKNIAHQTRIELGEEVGTMRKVTKGLKQNDRVIRIGLQNVRPETPVAPAKIGTETKTAAEIAGMSEEEALASETASSDKKEGN